MGESKVDTQDTNAVLQRIAAQIIDNIAIFLIAFVPIAIIATTFTVLQPTSDLAGGILVLSVFSIFILVGLGYEPFLEYYWAGQTLGKKALSIRVVKEDGSQIGGKEALLRNIPVIGTLIPYYGLFGYTAALISMAATDKRQRLFDQVAGTVVIKEN